MAENGCECRHGVKFLIMVAKFLIMVNLKCYGWLIFYYFLLLL